MEQMAKNQEERSLLAEQREQEKGQMLEYMEQLQEDDLRVTGRTDNAKFHQQQQQSSPRFGGIRVWTDFSARHMLISQHHRPQLLWPC